MIHAVVATVQNTADLPANSVEALWLSIEL